MSLLIFVQFLTQGWVYKGFMFLLLLIPPCVSLCFEGSLCWVNLRVALLESSVQLLIDWGCSSSLISFQEHQVPSLVPHTIPLAKPLVAGQLTCVFPALFPFCIVCGILGLWKAMVFWKKSSPPWVPWFGHVSCLWQEAFLFWWWKTRSDHIL